MAWLYVPELEASSSESASPSQERGLFATLSGKPSRRPLSWHGWKTRAWARRLFGTISRPSTADRGAGRWISSLPASLVSHSALPASSSALKTSDGSGRSSSACLGKFNPDGSFSKTCLDLFGTDSDPSSVDWPNSGMMRSGAVSAWKRSAARIRDSGSTFSDEGWPTPRTPSGGAESAERKKELGRLESGGGDLQAEAQNWPTPRSVDAAGVDYQYSRGDRTKPVLGLSGAAKGWPTPRAEDSESSGARLSRGVEDTLTATSRSFLPAQPMKPHGYTSYVPRRSLPLLYRLLLLCSKAWARKAMRLNPAFVEWLIGWPRGWSDPSSAIEPTDSELVETEYTRWRRRMRSELSSITRDG